MENKCMKPYCRNNSNYTFREICCAPIKKDCDKGKDSCKCYHGDNYDCFPFPPCMDNFTPPPPPEPCKEENCHCRRPIIVIFRR